MGAPPGSVKPHLITVQRKRDPNPSPSAGQNQVLRTVHLHGLGRRFPLRDSLGEQFVALVLKCWHYSSPGFDGHQSYARGGRPFTARGQPRPDPERRCSHDTNTFRPDPERRGYHHDTPLGGRRQGALAPFALAGPTPCGVLASRPAAALAGGQDSTFPRFSRRMVRRGGQSRTG